MPDKLPHIGRLKLIEQTDMMTFWKLFAAHRDHNGKARAFARPGHTSVNRFAAMLQLLDFKRPAQFGFFQIFPRKRVCTPYDKSDSEK